MSATRTSDSSRTAAYLYVSFELGEGKWTLSCTVGFGRKPRQRDVVARDLVAVDREIQRAKERFGLPEDVPLVSCYEAGRDGFWLHRYLLSVGVENLVVDSASIQVDRRKPGSELSRWYERKFAHGSKRRRKIGIVALARKLLVELWKYLQTGVPPSGAELGDWRTKISYTPALTQGP